jgi:hypothetical protein
LQTFSQKRTKKIFSAAAEASGSVFQKVSGSFRENFSASFRELFFQRGFKEFQGDLFREIQRAPYYLSLSSP